MFGLGEKKEKEKQEIQKPQTKFDVKYMGGHKAYPVKKQRDARILVFLDRIEIQSDKFLFNIPYSQMTNIENMDEKKMSALRVVGLGLVFLPLAIVGALWKKKKVYTVIEYNDGIDTQTVIFDFEKHLEKQQAVIYQKMIAARTKNE